MMYFSLANIAHIQPNPSGGHIWSGTIAGVPHSTVSIVIKDGLMTGDIRLPGAGIELVRLYQIRPGASGYQHHIVRQVVMEAVSSAHEDMVIPPNIPTYLKL